MNIQASITPDTQRADLLPSEVVAFCGLLARIMHRCLRERDPRILSLIDVPVATVTQNSEVSHEYAA
jgi:hypothetical protein